MLIGVPKEIKTQEYRVGLVPGSVRELVHHGHSLLVEAGAGLGTGFGDEAYAGAGAAIAGDAAEVFAKADMIVKVKERKRKKFGFCAPDKFSSPICILLQISALRKLYFARGPLASPVRQSPTLAVGCSMVMNHQTASSTVCPTVSKP